MYELYEITLKSKDNPKGCKLVSDNPFTSPCILTLTGDETSDLDVFGTSKNILKMARLRTRGDNASSYSVKDFPVKFLALKYSSKKDITKKEYLKQIIDFVNTYFMPIIMEDNVLYDKETIKKNLRNINIITYCVAASEAILMIECIKNKLQSLKVDEDDIKEILSQIGVITIANASDLSKIDSTTIDIFDINDQMFLYDNYLDKTGMLPANYISARNSKYGTLTRTNNYGSILYKGTGIHDIKEYNKNLIGLITSKLVVNLIKNILDNIYKEELVPLTIDTLIDGVHELLIMDDNIDLDVMRKAIDNNLEYKGATKLTQEELDELDKIDTGKVK